MSSDRQWFFQIIPSSGLSADYTNHLNVALDPIHKKGSTLREATDAIKERVLQLSNYTDYARASAQSSGDPSDFDVFVNDANKEAVARVDALVAEMKAEVCKPIDQIDLTLVCGKAESIYSFVMGEAIVFQLFRKSLASLIQKARSNV